MLLSGDRNITNSSKANRRLVSFSTNQLAGGQTICIAARATLAWPMEVCSNSPQADCEIKSHILES